MFDIITASDTELTYYTLSEIQCEKCDGTGFQQRSDGVYVICPICEGSGRRTKKIECPSCNPYVPREQPWYPIDIGKFIWHDPWRGYTLV